QGRHNQRANAGKSPSRSRIRRKNHRECPSSYHFVFRMFTFPKPARPMSSLCLGLKPMLAHAPGFAQDIGEEHRSLLSTLGIELGEYSTALASPQPLRVPAFCIFDYFFAKSRFASWRASAKTRSSGSL